MKADDPANQRPFALGSAVLLTLAVLIVAYGALWTAGWRVRAFMSGQTDLGSYFVPKYQYAADRIATGALPQWNPYEFAGAPFLATIQPSVFYPPVRLVYAALSGEDAYVALFLIHLVIAAVGSLLLARDLGLALWPAVLAAAWVTQPVWLVRIYDHPVFLTGATWVPLLLLTSRRVVRTPSARNMAGLAIVAALQAVSGYPPMVLATSYLLALALVAWLLERSSTPDPAPARRIFSALLGASALAALLAAAQILPTLELALLTDRASEAERTRAMLASLSALSDDTLLYMGLPPTSLRATLEAAVHRFGVFLLLPAALAPLLRPRSAAVWFSVCALVLTAGMPSWSYRLLPLSSFVRFGYEWLFLATFVVYLLAAQGLDAALAARSSAGGWWHRWRSRSSSRTSPARGAIERWRVAAPAALALVVLANVASWRQVDPRWLALDFGTPLPLPDETFQCELDDPRYRSFWTFGHVRGSLMHERVRSPTGYEQSLLPQRTAALQEVIGIGNGIVLPSWAESVTRESLLAARLALRCIVTTPAPALETGGFEKRPSSSGAPFRVYVSTLALPRARLEHTVRHASSAAGALDLARTAPLTGVILESDEATGAPCADPKNDRAEIVHEEPEELHVRTQSSCPGYLVLADSYAPGWSATVDGTPAPILVADFAFRAVPIPAGEHAVRFRYTAPGVRSGIATSLIGVALTITCLLRRPAP